MAAQDPDPNQIPNMPAVDQTPPVAPMPSEYDIASPLQGSAPDQPAPPATSQTQSPNAFPEPTFAPAPNMPPAVPPQPQETPSPMPTQSTPSPSVSSTVTPKSGGGVKRFLPLILFLLLLIVGIFAVVRFVLPNLGGGVGGGKVELVWWGLWEDTTIIQPIIDEYQNANPNVTIRYEKKAKEDYRERLTSALATDQAPDIFRMHNSWVPMFRQELATAPSSVITSQEFQSTFYPVAAENLLGAAGPVAMPLEYDGLAMFINEDIFATYGQPIPSDWNDLRQIARALTIKDERGVITQSGASLGTTENVDHWPEIVALLMLQNGADPNKPNDPSGRGYQALRFYKQFADVDEVWDSTLPESTIAFATGRVAMYIGPSWRAYEIKDRNPSLNFRVVPVPQIPQSDPNARDMTYASYWVEGVSQNSDHVEEAWKFLKFMSESETLAKLYSNASAVRLFGEPYPRVDMRQLLLSDPVVGGFVELAPVAKSGYLYSRTFDGASGINTSLVQYYADTLNAINASRDGSGEREMATLSAGVQQVLSRYGLAAPLPTATPR